MRVGVVGSGRSVHVLGRSAAVAAAGHEVRLFTLGPVLPADGLDTRTQPIPRGLAAAARAFGRFRREVRAFDPELLHLHYAGGRLGTLATLTGVRPLVVTVMGSDVTPEHHEAGLPWLERRATRRILAQADLVLAKSDVLRRRIGGLAGPELRVETVRWGVDPERFRRDPDAGASLARRLGLEPDDRAVVSPRLLRPLYNVDRIVEAMPQVLASCPRAVLLLTEYQADTAYRARLESRLAELGLGDRVRFIGRVEHDDMPALLSLAEVVVSVPRADGLPQSLFEAMACGAPVVLSRLPGYQEVVSDGETALFVDPDPGAVATAVAHLLKDADLRERVSRQARERVVEIACLPRDVERVARLYEEVARAGPRGKDRGLSRGLDALSLLVR